MGFKQIIGLIGSILLILGVFIPLVKIPIVGGISFYDNSKLEAVIVILIAVISIFLVVLKRYILLWLSGFALLAVVSVRGIQVIRKVYSARSTAEKILGEKLTAKLTKKLTSIAIEHVDIGLGLIFLVLGAILIILCAFLATKGKRKLQIAKTQA